MMRLDEYDLELAQASARRLESDDEHERFGARRGDMSRRPRHPRFETLAQITDAVARAAHTAHQPSNVRSEAA